jgi:hypothetical protein
VAASGKIISADGHWTIFYVQNDESVDGQADGSKWVSNVEAMGTDRDNK